MVFHGLQLQFTFENLLADMEQLQITKYDDEFTISIESIISSIQLTIRIKHIALMQTEKQMFKDANARLNTEFCKIPNSQSVSKIFCIFTLLHKTKMKSNAFRNTRHSPICVVPELSQ